MPRKMPRGFRVGHDGAIACSHRDVTCCGECERANPEIVNVLGAAYWVADPLEREELRREVAESNARLRKRRT